VRYKSINGKMSHVSLLLDVQVFVNFPNSGVGKKIWSSKYLMYSCGQIFLLPWIWTNFLKTWRSSVKYRLELPFCTCFQKMLGENAHELQNSIF
jgi:hypothetical protein